MAIKQCAISQMCKLTIYEAVKLCNVRKTVSLSQIIFVSNELQRVLYLHTAA